MSESALAEKLWDLGNYITAFAVAQVLATTFGVAKREWGALTGDFAHKISLWATGVFTVFYIAAIVWCGYEVMQLSPEHHLVHEIVIFGQVSVVVLFTAILFLALNGHWKEDRAKGHRATP